MCVDVCKRTYDIQGHKYKYEKMAAESKSETSQPLTSTQQPQTTNHQPPTTNNLLLASQLDNQSTIQQTNQRRSP